MLSITLISLLLAIPLASTYISATLLTRITAVAMLYAAALAYNGVSSEAELDAGVGLYSGLIHSTTITQYMEVFLLVSGALILLPWASMSNGNSNAGYTATPKIPEYPMIILFTTLGGTFLLASADLVSMYLAIELQSFGVYILSALYRDSEPATAAGLKYFLLGALSSALILLGSALVYGYTGLTNLDSIYELLSVPTTNSYNGAITLGFILISIGLLFKVASAPFHYWAPDVYDGTPTIVTTWLTVMPKISIFVFLLELYRGIGANSLFAAAPALVSGLEGVDSLLSNASVNLLLVCAFLSLVIGTVVGLGQFRFKRLMAYSTISHVGFLLLALAIASSADSTLTSAGQDSVEAFLFYIMQYSLTNINMFFILLAFGYLIAQTVPMAQVGAKSQDVEFISELQGQFRSNPILGLSLAICLFSMAGVPPLVGFFAKYTVLYSAIHGGYLFLAIVAILASVVSAAYYLRIIRVVHFDAIPQDNMASSTIEVTDSVSSIHSYIVAVLTLAIMLFALAPNLLLDSPTVMALSLYTG